MIAFRPAASRVPPRLAWGLARGLAWGLVLALLLVRAAAASCTVDPLATVPLEVAGARLLLPMTVNGEAATFQLDTGAERSLATPQGVRRLGLARDRWVSSTVMGIGGIERRSVADPSSLTLGGLALRRRNALRDRTLGVADLSDAQGNDPAIDGLLGRDFLSAFDVVVDVPARSLTLWQVRGCAGRFLPWQTAYDAIGALPAYGNALVLAVQADGTPLRALPDTGASDTLLTASGMGRLGVDGGRLAGSGGVTVARTGGVGRLSRPVWPMRLSRLMVGSDEQRDVRVLGSALRVAPIVDILLGADWFRTRRVWLSYATGQVFVARPR